jgi:hypothetical protein
MHSVGRASCANTGLDGKHYVAGDTNEDRTADFIIEIVGTTNLKAGDFLPAI